MMRQILVLDLDGVLHQYSSGWQGPTNIPDPPVEGAIEFLLAATQEFCVTINSARCRYPGGMEAIRDWLAQHGVDPKQVYCVERWEDGMESAFEPDVIIITAQKPPAFLTIDDRVFCFDGKFPSVADLKAFKPWFKRPAQIPPPVISPQMIAAFIGRMIAAEPELTSRVLDYRVPVTEEQEARIPAVTSDEGGISLSPLGILSGILDQVGYRLCLTWDADNKLVKAEAMSVEELGRRYPPQAPAEEVGHVQT